MKAKGSFQLAARTLGSFAQLAKDALDERAGRALPITQEQVARPEVVNDLLDRFAPGGRRVLPEVKAVRLPGVDFESSNCINFLIEVDFETPAESAEEALPKTIYVKIPCAERGTRSFAHTLGFWSLETAFCAQAAQAVPIRIPRVYAAAEQGARFVLLLENLHETPGMELFINRDMAAGTTVDRAERVLTTFAELHAHFWDWPEADRDALLPAALNTYLAPRSREMTRALNASALSPALRAAPDLLSPELGETYRRAIKKWDALLDYWYTGPLTLVHGDSHLGNCFEYPAEGAKDLQGDGGGTRVGMIDFQAAHWSKGIRDVQYFLINSLDPELLAQNEDRLIRFYCDALAQHDISLTPETAFEQYRAFSFQTLVVGVVPLGLSNLTERNETVRAITRRSAAAIERLGFREWLDAL
ncbi:MAG: phosphotransferase [Myxococcota bacterium]